MTTMILLQWAFASSLATSGPELLNDEQKFDYFYSALEKGQIVTCIAKGTVNDGRTGDSDNVRDDDRDDSANDCHDDYALFLHALDQYYYDYQPDLPLKAPLYPDSGYVLSYYLILKEHFDHIPVPPEVYERLEALIADDPENLVPILQDLSESDPFFLRYISWVKGKSFLEPDPYDLVMGDKRIDEFMNGKYSKGIQIYQFCRTNREYPCRLILKDKDGSLVRRKDGSIWSIPVLALAKSRKPYYQVSGNTPSGIYTIDGVMPYADKVRSFGKFRRLILNFIPKSPDETSHRLLLPTSHQYLSWWQEGVAARKVGRKLLRIHGSGKQVTTPDQSWYTFVPTQGCINSRENTYSGITFRDQRYLLDEIMKAIGLPVAYANETKIYGLLYVINVDSQAAAVSEADLASWGLK